MGFVLALDERPCTRPNRTTASWPTDPSNYPCSDSSLGLFYLRRTTINLKKIIPFTWKPLQMKNVPSSSDQKIIILRLPSQDGVLHYEPHPILGR